MPELQNNPEIVMAAVKQNGMAIRFAYEELQENLEIVLAAVRTPGVFQMIYPAIRRNKQVLLIAVVVNTSEVYENLPRDLKEDEEVVMAYISGTKQYYKEERLRRVPEEFKRNPRGYSYSLEFANPELLPNRECAHINGAILQYLPKFQDDKEIVSIIHLCKRFRICKP
jgi:hypothetical protein